jgi:hypothetical protein
MGQNVPVAVETQEASVVQKLHSDFSSCRLLVSNHSTAKTVLVTCVWGTDMSAAGAWRCLGCGDCAALASLGFRGKSQSSAK